MVVFNDFCIILPYDIIQSILSQLDLKDILVCLQVSKTWRDITLDTPCLWYDLDYESINISPCFDFRLSSARRLTLAKGTTQELITRTFDTIISSNCHSFRTLELSMPCDIGILFKTIESLRSSLTHLRLDNTSLPLDICFNTLLPITQLTHLSLRHCAWSSKRTFINDPKSSQLLSLKVLDLSYLDWRYVRSGCLVSVLRRCRYLQQLVLYGIRIDAFCPILRLMEESWPDLQGFHYDPYTNLLDHTWLPSSNNVKQLSLRTCKVRSDVLSDDLVNSVARISHHSLYKLDISRNWHLTDRSCSVFASFGLPCLRELSLFHCSCLSESGLSALLLACPVLTFVDMSYCQGVTDQVVNVLSKLVLVQYVNMSSCPYITSSSVMSLVNQNQKLKQCLVDNCSLVIREKLVCFVKTLMREIRLFFQE
ncbi:hypothetical protein J3Q64DRAFT_1702616 [Phycomyces blakesleeanus]|uniref:F-box domain-containing protein n=2 Tax=Phycomyces blakesleeanus TaxID=4837 RepID=A0A162U003_PHYB8|nr:hypothetical protein PHYBLDRAFT_170601 [Phycomyces blakesleeanus NRRL 1555(-)]OAD71223.1 hypothetical protein PHYBLDRAFT_170601 [Phycomyces blakesleeanus NRRL 1555(-)]|eukprot:XP_018289263.1 hypothetical protein PHYBLDRAFT_170601 [Phycomyces blakesleeanus NRRL 1555(-)]